MTLQSMTDFLAAAARDDALAGRLREAVAEEQGPAAFDAIADLAASAGYEVGPADVRAFRLQALAEFEGELGDDQLEALAGGVANESLTDVLDATVRVANVPIDMLDNWLRSW